LARTSDNALGDSVLRLIRNTPLERLRALETPRSALLLAKLENLNPGGNVKDRAALVMVEDAAARGVLKPGMALIESTGGNMGVALAVAGTAKGYKVSIVMPEGVPLERRRLVARFGATVHLTPADMGADGSNQAARRMLDSNKDMLMLDQFNNAANARSHQDGTGREILDATQAGG
jgi:cysteine synthase